MLFVCMGSLQTPPIIDARGETDDLVAESSAVIGLIYANRLNNSTEEAKKFRSTLLSILADPDSPVWDAQMALGLRVENIDIDELRKQMEEAGDDGDV